VIAREDQHIDLVQARHGAALPARQPRGEILQAAQTARRLGEVRLTRTDLGAGAGVARRQIPAGGPKRVKLAERRHFNPPLVVEVQLSRRFYAPMVSVAPP